MVTIQELDAKIAQLQQERQQLPDSIFCIQNQRLCNPGAGFVSFGPREREDLKFLRARQNEIQSLIPKLEQQRNNLIVQQRTNEEQKLFDKIRNVFQTEAAKIKPPEPVIKVDTTPKTMAPEAIPKPTEAPKTFDFTSLAIRGGGAIVVIALIGLFLTSRGKKRGKKD